MRYIIITLAAILLFALTGCSAQPDIQEIAESDLSEQAADTSDSMQMPENTQPPEPAACAFEVNRYAVSASAAEYLGDTADYKTLIDAVCSGQKSVQASDAESAERAAAVFRESPYSAFATVELEDGMFQITYNGKGDVETFEKAAKGIVESAVYAEANQVETALSLYRAVASGFTLEGGEEGTLYSAVVERRGGTEQFATALNYLFIQNGIPSDVVSGTVGNAQRLWVTAELNGVRCHFDAAAESGATNGEGLRYFGTSDEARAEAGSIPPYTVGQGVYAQTVENLCADTRFDELFSDVMRFEIDVYGHFAYLAYDGSTEYQGSISTNTFSAPLG